MQAVSINKGQSSSITSVWSLHGPCRFRSAKRISRLILSKTCKMTFLYLPIKLQRRASWRDGWTAVKVGAEGFQTGWGGAEIALKDRQPENLNGWSWWMIGSEVMVLVIDRVGKSQWPTKQKHGDENQNSWPQIFLTELYNIFIACGQDLCPDSVLTHLSHKICTVSKH